MSEVEQRPTLVTAGYGRHRRQRVKFKMYHPDEGDSLVSLVMSRYTHLPGRTHLGINLQTSYPVTTRFQVCYTVSWAFRACFLACSLFNSGYIALFKAGAFPLASTMTAFTIDLGVSHSEFAPNPRISGSVSHIGCSHIWAVVGSLRNHDDDAEDNVD